MILIGLAGRPKCGRTTITRYLVEQCGFAEIPIVPPAVSPQQRMTLSADILAVWHRYASRLINLELRLAFPGVVVPDLERDEEADWLRSLGGAVWFVARPGYLTAGPPDWRGITPTPDDRGLINDGTIADLVAHVDNLVDQAHALPAND